MPLLGRMSISTRYEHHMTHRLGVLTSHPIQYQAPLFRELAKQVELNVFFAHSQTAQEQSKAGFNVDFDWDVDLLGGYRHQFLQNRAKHPDVSRFTGCDTPQIAAEIRRGNFDAFLVTGWYLRSHWQATRACHKYRVPVMVRGDSQLGTPRSWFKQSLKEFLYPLLLRQFDACCYVGQRNREYLEHYGVPPHRLFFSPHCIDNDWFSSLCKKADRQQFRDRFRLEDDVKTVLFVGKLLDRKRPLDMINALRVLLNRGLRVCGLFAGGGPLTFMLREYGKRYDVPLHFLGFRNQSELPEVYAGAEVLVLPSEGSETWGLVVNESLACGTRVVLSDAVGCALDMVDAGSTGEVYPVGDITAFADALQRVLTTPLQPEAIRQKMEEFSVAQAVKGIINAVTSLSAGCDEAG